MSFCLVLRWLSVWILLSCSLTVHAVAVGNYFEFSRVSKAELQSGYYVVTPHSSNTTFLVDNTGDIRGSVTLPGSLWLSEFNEDGSMSGIISYHYQSQGLPSTQTGFHIDNNGREVFQPDDLLKQLETEFSAAGMSLLTIHHDFTFSGLDSDGNYQYFFLSKAISGDDRDKKKNFTGDKEDFLVKATYLSSENKFVFSYVSILKELEGFTGRNLEEVLFARCPSRTPERWLHTNSIDYSGDNFYVSLRNINSVAVFSQDLQMLNVVMLSGVMEMHDVTKTDTGYALFNNNICSGEKSEVHFTDNDGAVTKRFSTLVRSGAYGSVSELANSNVLYCNGVNGLIVESDSVGNVLATIQLKTKHYIGWLKAKGNDRNDRQVTSCYRAQKIKSVPAWLVEP